ncbi:stromal 70 kDa heat shock-related protein chloroplastic-like [Canna indica]|uniref:Stromal 70 kDa heat shock-related protein chloroplastic-like n=1 Tax=Canna indica TaxID=4628 RepID=A0AAQ3KIY0_9LILI|nr:stromal 70 kDa heat shock-related protein chloroplastic-like [Canna indica]
MAKHHHLRVHLLRGWTWTPLLLLSLSNSAAALNMLHCIRIVDWLASDFKRDERIKLLKDKQALQRLIETSEKAKMELSSLTQTSIRHLAILSLIPFILPFITTTADGPKHIEMTLTRAKFEELCSYLLDRAMEEKRKME